MARLRRGFTLVELLVVIAIIGILMALLVPALAAVRESARGAQCQNNLKEIGTACNNFRTKWTFYPSGGWGPRWAGDPMRGADIKQPAGWVYNILPFVGEEDVHDLGRDKSDTDRRATGASICSRGPATSGGATSQFKCPTRALPMTIPYAISPPYYNIDPPSLIGFTDYAGNAGDVLPGTTAGPSTLAQGDSWTMAQWSQVATNTPDPLHPGFNLLPTGVIYLRSMVKSVPHGEVCTYLVGEKCMNTLKYDGAGDQGWDIGFDPDINRWTYYDKNNTSTATIPYQDGKVDHKQSFGGPHSSGSFVVFCDGHTMVVNFDVDPDVHRQLGNRFGTPTDVTLAQ